MTDIDLRPRELNISHYGGDTLTMHVKIDAALLNGREIKAQVRSKREYHRVEAEFVTYLQPYGADLVLKSEDCQRLMRHGMFNGFWDLQLSKNGHVDPVTTLAQGKLKIYPDVTRGVK